MVDIFMGGKVNGLYKRNRTRVEDMSAYIQKHFCTMIFDQAHFTGRNTNNEHLRLVQGYNVLIQRYVLGYPSRLQFKEPTASRYFFEWGIGVQC
jgi:hypothetical protein